MFDDRCVQPLPVTLQALYDSATDYECFGVERVHQSAKANTDVFNSDIDDFLRHGVAFICRIEHHL